MRRTCAKCKNDFICGDFVCLSCTREGMEQVQKTIEEALRSHIARLTRERDEAIKKSEIFDTAVGIACKERDTYKEAWERTLKIIKELTRERDRYLTALKDLQLEGDDMNWYSKVQAALAENEPKDA